MSGKKATTQVTIEDVVSGRLQQSPFHPMKILGSPENRKKGSSSPISRKFQPHVTLDPEDVEIMQELARGNISEVSMVPILNAEQFPGEVGSSPATNKHQSAHNIRSLSASPAMTARHNTNPNSPPKTVDANRALVNSRRRVSTLRSPLHPDEVEFQNEQMRTLKVQCAELVRRLKTVEKMSTQLKDKQIQELCLPRRINRSFHAVQNKLYNLGRTFLAGQDKMRDIAATHISRCIRGWLARKKYHRALHALREWRNQETTHFRNHVIVWVANQEIIQKKIENVRNNHFMRVAGIMLKEWHAISQGNITSVIQLHKKEEQLQIKHWHRVLRRMVSAWRDTALGPHSRKRVSQSYKDRFELAQHRLLNLQLNDEPSAKDIHREFRRLSIAMFRQEKLRRIFQAWFKHIFQSEESQKIQNDKALSHYWNGLALRMLRRWVTWTKHVRALMKTPKGAIHQKYLDSLNVTDGDSGHDRTGGYDESKLMRRRNRLAEVYRQHWDLQRKVFRQWRRRVLIKREVETRVKAKALAIMAHAFVEFRRICQAQRKMKLQVVQQWVASSLSRLETSFKAWYVWYARRRAERSSKEFLVQAFIRRRRQRLVSLCFKNWRKAVALSINEASWLYEDVPELSKRYDEQLHSNTLLKKAVDNYRKLLEGFEETLRNQEQLHHKKEGMIGDKDNELLSAKLALHNAQMEVQRLNTLMQKSLLRYVVPLKNVAMTDPPTPTNTAPSGQANQPQPSSLSPYPSAGAIATEATENSSDAHHEGLVIYDYSKIPLPSMGSDTSNDVGVASASAVALMPPPAPRRVLGKTAVCIVPNDTVADDSSLWKGDRSKTDDDDQGPPLTDPKPKSSTNSLAILSKLMQSSPTGKKKLPPMESPKGPNPAATAVVGAIIEHTHTPRSSRLDAQTPTEDLDGGAKDLTSREFPLPPPSPVQTGHISTSVMSRSVSLLSEKSDVNKTFSNSATITAPPLASSKASSHMDFSELLIQQKRSITPLLSASGPPTPIQAALPKPPSSPYARSPSPMPKIPTAPTVAVNSEQTQDSSAYKPVEAMELLDRAKFLQQALEYLQLDPNSPNPQSVSLLNFLRAGTVNSDIKEIEKKIKQQHQTQELMKRLHRTSQTVTWGDILGFVDDVSVKKSQELL
eukprot:TRINITY_DN3415_c0_g2_i11.p1 TRINITY_DN3415_c0_g2~~TRINITY_DN3415_c0_g2_i11.p1  ORF type:complete len:1144 (-),score=180.23 TRINITY_DN3415_c0_g2_i11:180-3611(-)